MTGTLKYLTRHLHLHLRLYVFSSMGLGFIGSVPQQDADFRHVMHLCDVNLWSIPSSFL